MRTYTESTAEGRKLKIAMLGHKRIPSREGGIEVVVEELAAGMAARGHKVTCYNRRGHHVGGREFDNKAPREYRGIRIKSVFTINGKGLAAVTASFAAAIRGALGDYDIVHFHAEGPAIACFIPRIAGKRVVVTIHGLDHRRDKWGRLARWVILRGEKNAVRYAHSIIVLSQAMQDYFLESYHRKTMIIPNGVDPAEYKEADVIKSKWGLNRDGYILFLARLVPEKGAHFLIDAFKRLNWDGVLVIAGGSSDSGDYVKWLKSRAAGIEDRVVFTGFVCGRELEELYSNAYIYVLPSLLEGMPIGLLEAMSYGNCCVASDIPECAPVIGDKGLVFENGSVDSLLCRLESLLEAPEEIRRFKSMAAAYVTEKYGWGGVIDSTLRVYEGKDDN